MTETAKQQGQLPEAVAVQWLVTATENLAGDPFEQFIGAISSDVPDWADRHDEYIGRALMVELRESEGQDRAI